MGYLGKPAHPEAEAKAVEGIKRIRGAGKPAGVFARNAEDARNKIAAGASFVSLGTDIGLLAAACRQLVASVDRVDAAPHPKDRQRVVKGQSVSVRVDLGGRRILNKKTIYDITN